ISVDNLKIDYISPAPLSVDDLTYTLNVKYTYDFETSYEVSFDAATADFDTILSSVPADAYLYCYSAKIDLKPGIYTESDFAAGDIIVLGAAASSDVRYDINGQSLEFAYNGVTEPYSRIDITHLFGGLTSGDTTLAQLDKIYDTINVSELVVDSCSLGDDYTAEDFSVSIGADLIDANGNETGTQYFSNSVEINSFGNDDERVKSIWVQVTAKESLIEKSGISAGTVFYVNGQPDDIFRYEYTGKPVNMQVKGATNVYGLECRLNIDLTDYLRAAHDDIVTLGDLRRYYSHIAFTGFVASSVGGDVPDDFDLGQVYYSYSMMTDNYAHWYGCWNNSWNLSEIAGSDDEIIDSVFVDICVSESYLAELGLNIGDTVTINPGDQNVCKVEAGIGNAVTATAFKDDDGRIGFNVIRESIDIPGITMGESTVGDLMAAYGAIHITDADLVGTSDPRLDFSDFYTIFHLNISATEENPDSWGAITVHQRTIFDLNDRRSVYHYVDNGSLEPFDYDTNSTMNYLLFSIYTLDDLADKGFEEGDEVTFYFNTLPDPVTTDDWANLHVEGYNLVWDAHPQENDYVDEANLADYRLYNNGNLLTSRSFDATYDGRSIDLRSLFAKMDIESGEMNLSIALFDTNAYAEVERSAELAYHNTMGKVLDSVAVPDVESFTVDGSTYIMNVNKASDEDINVLVLNTEKFCFTDSHCFCISDDTQGTVGLYRVDKYGNRSKTISVPLPEQEDWANLRVEGYNLVWNAHPQESEQYNSDSNSVGYCIYADGELVVHYYYFFDEDGNGLSEYSWDLRLGLANKNIEPGEMTFSVALLNSGGWAEVAASEEITYNNEMGQTLDSVPVPVVEKFEYLTDNQYTISFEENPDILCYVVDWDSNLYVTQGGTSYSSGNYIPPKTIKVYSVDAYGNRSNPITVDVPENPDDWADLHIDGYNLVWNAHPQETEYAQSDRVSYNVYYSFNDIENLLLDRVSFDNAADDGSDVIHTADLRVLFDSVVIDPIRFKYEKIKLRICLYDETTGEEIGMSLRLEYDDIIGQLIDSIAVPEVDSFTYDETDGKYTLTMKDVSEGDLFVLFDELGTMKHYFTDSIEFSFDGTTPSKINLYRINMAANRSKTIAVATPGNELDPDDWANLRIDGYKLIWNAHPQESEHYDLSNNSVEYRIYYNTGDVGSFEVGQYSLDDNGNGLAEYSLDLRICFAAKDIEPGDITLSVALINSGGWEEVARSGDIVFSHEMGQTLDSVPVPVVEQLEYSGNNMYGFRVADDPDILCCVVDWDPFHTSVQLSTTFLLADWMPQPTMKIYNVDIYGNRSNTITVDVPENPDNWAKLYIDGHDLVWEPDPQESEHTLSGFVSYNIYSNNYGSEQSIYNVVFDTSADGSDAVRKADFRILRDIIGHDHLEDKIAVGLYDIATGEACEHSLYINSYDDSKNRVLDSVSVPDVSSFAYDEEQGRYQISMNKISDDELYVLRYGENKENALYFTNSTSFSFNGSVPSEVELYRYDTDGNRSVAITVAVPGRDTEDWADLHVDGYNLIWNVHPQESQYIKDDLVVYNVYINGIMHQNVWMWRGDGYTGGNNTYDLRRLFACGDIPLGDITISVKLFDWGNWSDVGDISSGLVYANSMGQVLDSVPVPEVQSFTYDSTADKYSITCRKNSDLVYFVLKRGTNIIDVFNGSMTFTWASPTDTVEIYGVDCEGNRSKSITAALNSTDDWANLYIENNKLIWNTHPDEASYKSSYNVVV
ncbi:MAG: hypothetical protein ACI4WS_01955, partial [Oscillospiraceae bacterium]